MSNDVHLRIENMGFTIVALWRHIVIGSGNGWLRDVTEKPLPKPILSFHRALVQELFYKKCLWHYKFPVCKYRHLKQLCGCVIYVNTVVFCFDIWM